MIRAVLGMLGVLAVSCTAMSPATYTTVSCEACRVRAVAVDQPLVIGLDWPCGDEDEWHSCADDVRPIVECVGAPCTVTTRLVSGGGAVYVRPTGPGRLTVRLRLKTLGHSEHVELGPVHVHKPDRLALACFARAPGQSAWRSCDQGVVNGDDVRVDAVVLAGTLQLSGAAPTVNADGTAMKSSGDGDDRVRRGEKDVWYCAATLSDATGSGPGHSCFAYGIPPGAHRVSATFGSLANETSFEAVAARPATAP